MPFAGTLFFSWNIEWDNFLPCHPSVGVYFVLHVFCLCRICFPALPDVVDVETSSISDHIIHSRIFLDLNGLSSWLSNFRGPPLDLQPN